MDPMETAPIVEAMVEDAAEAVVDLASVVDAIGQLQETVYIQTVILVILCGIVLGALVAVLLHEMWRR